MSHLDPIRQFASQDPNTDLAFRLLESDRAKYVKMVMEVKKLIGALDNRLIMMKELRVEDPIAVEMRRQFIELVETINKFLRHTIDPPENRAEKALMIYQDLMNKVTKKS